MNNELANRVIREELGRLKKVAIESENAALRPARSAVLIVLEHRLMLPSHPTRLTARRYYIQSKKKSVMALDILYEKVCLDSNIAWRDVGWV